jgi:hypothetical protein
MNVRLCLSPRCRIYGDHDAARCRDGCTGCAPRPATVGYLCRPCCDGLGENGILAAALHGELEQDLVAGGGGTGGGGGVNPFPSVSFDSSVSAARAQIQANLAGWCRVIVEEGGFAPPDATWQAAGGLAVLGRYINRHREWIAAQLWADEVCDQLADLVHIGRRGQDHVQPSVVEVEGSCPQCDAPMTAIVRRGMTSPTEAVCTGEGQHRWQGERALAELARLVGARDEWMSARDVARRYDRKLGTIQRLALSEGWKRTEDGRPTLYHPDSVEKTMQRLGISKSASIPNSELKAGAA